MKKFFGLIILFLVILTGCEKNPSPISLRKTITYKISGTLTDGWIQYTDENGKYVGIPTGEDWDNETTIEFKARRNAYVYLSLRNNTGSGSVKVEIQKNGKTIYAAENTRPYGVAVVSGYINTVK